MYNKVLLACVLLCSCSTPRMIETDLYFGQSKPDGTRITEKEWNDFKVTRIAKVFKEGSTVINTTGNWYDTAIQTLIVEPTYVVVYVYRRSSKKSQQIDSLRFWYKELFQQTSVLRVDKKVKLSF